MAAMAAIWAPPILRSGLGARMSDHQNKSLATTTTRGGRKCTSKEQTTSLLYKPPPASLSRYPAVQETTAPLGSNGHWTLDALLSQGSENFCPYPSSLLPTECLLVHWRALEPAAGPCSSLHRLTLTPPGPLGQPEALLCSAHYMTTPHGPHHHISSDKEIGPGLRRCCKRVLPDGSYQLMSLAKGQAIREQAGKKSSKESEK